MVNEKIVHKQCEGSNQLIPKPTDFLPELASIIIMTISEPPYEIVYKLLSLKNKLYIITCTLIMFGMHNLGMATGKRCGILRPCAPLNHPDLHACVIDVHPITLA